MRPTGPKLDKHGFPIPPDFQAAGVDDPGRGPASFGPWLRRLLKVGVIAVVASGLWVHFDLNAKVGELFAQYHAQQAVDAAQRDDWDGALVQADRALSWSPQSIALMLLRAKINFARRDYEKGLVDLEAAIAVKPNDQEAQQLRLLCFHHLHRQRDAAAAAGEMLHRSIGTRAEVLNTRAYARALGDFELPEALADIDEALSDSPEESSFIDTRGYVLFKLGRHQEALADLERAIAAVMHDREEFERTYQGRRLSADQSELRARRQKQFEENLAVMYYHRGEVHEKLGNVEQAKKDQFVGKELGFNPAAGVY